jgi:succinyl-diaminopimelate desuccinylase
MISTLLSIGACARLCRACDSLRDAALGGELAQDIDPVQLTRDLIRVRTINPPGEEDACAKWLGGVLENYGFSTHLHSFGPKRYNLIAEFGGEKVGPWLGFSGHLDTVPLGGAPWTRDPFAADIEGGLLYGRGSTDMKSGVAAFIAACVKSRSALQRCPGVRLLLTGGEETGCYGAFALKAEEGERLEGLGALIVGEPTQNYPYIGHKGALWIRGCAKGETAHGSMPELGDNAIYKIMDAVGRLRSFKTDHFHPLMGRCTVSVGTISGGVNVNSVPDRACFEIDVRTVPGVDHAELCSRIADQVGPEVALETFVDVPALISAETHPWVRRVFSCCAKYHVQPIVPKVVPYFTDGSVLVPRSGALPAVILGPGEPQVMHKTDEYCRVDRLLEGMQVYCDVLLNWVADFETVPTTGDKETFSQLK